MRARIALFCSAVALLLTGCVVRQPAPNGFVAPNGQTQLWYEPGQRPTLTGPVAGPDLVTDARLSLDDPEFVGKVVVINTWAQWCGPCRGEAPALAATYRKTKSEGVAFLGVDLRDPTRDKPKDYVLDQGVTYPSIYDPEGRALFGLAQHVPTSVIPTTVVLDRAHAVAAVFLKAVTPTSLEPVVLRVLAESAPSLAATP